MLRTGVDGRHTSLRIHTRVVDRNQRDVESFNPNILGLAVLSSGLGMAMIWLAKRFSMLEQRRELRCPACGVIRRRGSCNCPS